MSARQNRSLTAVAMLLAGLLATLPSSGAWAQSGTHTISTAADPCLNVRARPSYRAEIVGCVDSGSEVQVSGEENGWSRIAALNGLQGWAGSRYLEPVGESGPSIRIERADIAAYEASAETGDLEQVATDRDQLAVRLTQAARRIEELEDQVAEMARQSLDAGLLNRTSLERDEALQRLESSEARAAALEVELASLRAASELSSSSSSSLAAELETANADRQRLARQLAQAEARQLYLQSDLERTRAELMRLKGVPPKLVQPPVEEEPEPAPVVEAQPEAVVEEELPLPIEPDYLRTDEVVQTVRAWAQSWSDQRVDDYLSFYSPAFVPTDGSSREEWAQTRRDRIARPRSIVVAVDQISPQVLGDRAAVSFVQSYTSDTFSDVVTKSLLLERAGGSWRILEERSEP